MIFMKLDEKVKIYHHKKIIPRSKKPEMPVPDFSFQSNVFDRLIINLHFNI